MTRIAFSELWSASFPSSRSAPRICEPRIEVRTPACGWPLAHCGKRQGGSTPHLSQLAPASHASGFWANRNSAQLTGSIAGQIPAQKEACFGLRKADPFPPATDPGFSLRASAKNGRLKSINQSSAHLISRQRDCPRPAYLRLAPPTTFFPFSTHTPPHQSINPIAVFRLLINKSITHQSHIIRYNGPH